MNIIVVSTRWTILWWWCGSRPKLMEIGEIKITNEVVVPNLMVHSHRRYVIVK
jgi:hypothetical protein